jgi:PhzF family phenazine biosynthesis protein
VTDSRKQPKRIAEICTEEKNMKQYIVDAFTDHVFHGNQAAICILDKWIPEELMMNIARENNFSETAFAVKEGDTYHLRWFTPGGEIDLCGHATLACAYVLFWFYIPEAEKIVFSTMSGDLIVTKKGDLLEMEFPAYQLKKTEVTKAMADALGAEPKEAYLGRDLLCVFDDESVVRGLTPDMEKVKKLDGLLLNVTAPGKETDCVSRSFAPKLNVIEDPVCGSGHCHIVPYWAERLGKNEIVAYQASQRGGTLYCRMQGDKIFMAGKAVLFSKSEIFV